MNTFADLNYEKYLDEYQFHKALKLDKESYGRRLDEKLIKSTYEAVDPNNQIPYPAELDDLIRLHYLVTSRRVTTILEIGVGKSTVVFNHALTINKEKYEDYVRENLRRANAFECHSVDNSKEWIDSVKAEFTGLERVVFHHSECNVTTFESRVCTLYEKLPNICPDLIYIDAPDQFSPGGDIRGISTRSVDRLPMSADVLPIEHFLLPGTLIVVDGRTANARFLRANLQRNWDYTYNYEFDQHFFELKEAPLGIYNKRQIEFCLGESWMS